MEIKMSEFEPLNIAHYQQPTTPLSDGAAPYMDWIEVKRLVTDKTYQREISRAGSINVERIAEYFEWAKFSPVIVAPVEGGMFSIIDGQHRATAAMLRGIEKVPCASSSGNNAARRPLRRTSPHTAPECPGGIANPDKNRCR
jgi:hypothetical protein